MFQKRTDMADEAHQLYNESAQQKTKLSGVIARDYERGGCKVTHVEIADKEGSTALGKPCGNYVTVEISAFSSREENGFERAVEAVSEELIKILNIKERSVVLIAGLGNDNITPDAIGPLSTKNIMITRHLVEKLPESFGNMRPIAAITPGVLGTTGIESAEIIKGVIDKVSPDAMIVIDALASRSMSRLCKSVQISDSGIVPGSGVGNARTAINKETLGIPVIAIGAPTVVDAATLAADLMENSGMGEIDPERLLGFGGDMIVTPKDIDSQVADVSKVIGYAVNRVMHPEMTIEEIAGFIN